MCSVSPTVPLTLQITCSVPSLPGLHLFNILHIVFRQIVRWLGQRSIPCTRKRTPE